MATAGPFAHDAALADLQRGGQVGMVTPDALAARIAEGARAGRRWRTAVATMCGQLGLVGGGHQHHAGQRAHEADVEGARVGRAVGADQAGAVDGEAHRQATGWPRRGRTWS